MEGYHIPFIHPGLAQSLSPSVYTYRLGEYSNEQYGAEPHPRGPGSRVAGILGGTQELRALKPPLRRPRRERGDGLLLPLGLPAHHDQLHARRHPHLQRPAARPERTETEFTWWFPEAKSFEDRLLQAAIVNFGHLVNTEDYEICEQAQRGMRSQVYRQGRYAAEQEMCLHHFHPLLATTMAPHSRPGMRSTGAPRRNSATRARGGGAMSPWSDADETAGGRHGVRGALRGDARGRGRGDGRRALGDGLGIELTLHDPDVVLQLDVASGTITRGGWEDAAVRVALPAGDMHDLLLDRLGPVEISRLVEEGRLHLKGSPQVLCAAVAAVARLQPHYEASLRERGREQLLATPAPVTRAIWESAEKPPAMFGVRRPWQAPKRAIADRSLTSVASRDQDGGMGAMPVCPPST